MRVPSPFTLRAALRRQAVLTCALVALAMIGAVALSGRVPLAGGLCAVRSRAIDVAVLAALAIGLGVLSTTPNL